MSKPQTPQTFLDFSCLFPLCERIEFRRQLVTFESAEIERRLSILTYLAVRMFDLGMPGNATVMPKLDGTAVAFVAFTGKEGARYFASVAGLWRHGSGWQVCADEWMAHFLHAFAVARQLRLSGGQTIKQITVKENLQ